MRTIITIDGPSGAGKGTVTRLVAEALGWHLLDSGALYRILGYAGKQAGVSLDDGEKLAELAISLEIAFTPQSNGDIAVWLNGDDITSQIRTEQGGSAASQVAVHPEVRQALLTLQRGFVRAPGLVADGRDMGTVVFPRAAVKIFLTASAEERAKRRHKQLKDMGKSVSLPRLLEDIQARDQRDEARAASPLIAADDAIRIDSTTMSIEEVTQRVLQEAERRSLS
ncbi:MAG: (d)CMP kinase [Pseudomonadales bacterium]